MSFDISESRYFVSGYHVQNTSAQSFSQMKAFTVTERSQIEFVEMRVNFQKVIDRTVIQFCR